MPLDFLHGMWYTVCIKTRFLHIMEESVSMRRKSLYRLALSAIFAALSCVATAVIVIPVPATGGYINFGDCFVLLGGFCLGPYAGALAGGIGSALADLLLGYAQYVPATFVIKGLMALLAGWLSHLMRVHKRTAFIGGLIRAGIGSIAECVMIFGYFAYEATLLGYGIGALAAMPQNIFQGICGLLLAALLMGLIQNIPSVRRGLAEFER